MNKKLNDAIVAAERAEALMYAIEKCYLDLEVSPAEAEIANRGAHTFYLLLDVIRDLLVTLEKLEGDRRVVDVIYAANKARGNGRTLKEE